MIIESVCDVLNWAIRVPFVIMDQFVAMQTVKWLKQSLGSPVVGNRFRVQCVVIHIVNHNVKHVQINLTI